MTRPGFRSARLLALLASGLMLLPISVRADTPVQAMAVTSCGNVTYTNGQVRTMTQDLNGKQCVNATVSASISGFAPATTGTPISVTTGGVTGTLPAGAVVIAFNTGATNTAYCKLGASSTTSDIAISPNGGWFAFTVGAATQLTCITSTSTTTVNMVGGAGLPTGTGGGGGGSGGGGTSSSFAAAYPATGTAAGVKNGANMVAITEGSATGANSLPVVIASDQSALTVSQATPSSLNATVVQPTASSLNATVIGTGTFATQSTVTAGSGSFASGALANGADVVEGNNTDAACAGDTTSGCSVEARLQRLTQNVTTLNSTAAAPIPAGSAKIGQVAIDQTTPGTTNAVAVTNLPTTVDTNSGAAGASTLRTVSATGNTSAATSTITSPAPAITITAGAYSANNVIGGIVSFTSQPTTGVIANASCTFDSGSFSAGTVDFNIFNASPSGGGTTDHAAYALTSTDTAKLVGVMHLNDCSSLGGVLAECQALYQNQFYTMAASGTTIFIVPVVRTGTPTFAGTGDMKCNIQVIK